MCNNVKKNYIEIILRSKNKIIILNFVLAIIVFFLSYSRDYVYVVKMSVDEKNLHVESEIVHVTLHDVVKREVLRELSRLSSGKYSSSAFDEIDFSINRQHTIITAKLADPDANKLRLKLDFVKKNIDTAYRNIKASEMRSIIKDFDSTLDNEEDSAYKLKLIEHISRIKFREKIYQSSRIIEPIKAKGNRRYYFEPIIPWKNSIIFVSFIFGIIMSILTLVFIEFLKVSRSNAEQIEKERAC